MLATNQVTLNAKKCFNTFASSGRILAAEVDFLERWRLRGQNFPRILAQVNLLAG